MASETLTASSRLRRLRDLDLLEKRGGGNRTHYVPGGAFTAGKLHGGLGPTTAAKAIDPHQAGLDPHQAGLDPHQAGLDPHQAELDPHQATVLGSTSGNLRSDLPESLRAQIPAAGSRPRRTQLRDVIRALCAWRPMGSDELAALLGGRDRKTLVREHLSPMVEAGELAYTIPNMVKHPEQKYTARAH